MVEIYICIYFPTHGAPPDTNNMTGIGSRMKEGRNVCVHTQRTYRSNGTAAAAAVAVAPIPPTAIAARGDHMVAVIIIIRMNVRIIRRPQWWE